MTYPLEQVIDRLDKLLNKLEEVEYRKNQIVRNKPTKIVLEYFSYFLNTFIDQVKEQRSNLMLEKGEKLLKDAIQFIHDTSLLIKKEKDKFNNRYDDQSPYNGIKGSALKLFQSYFKELLGECDFEQNLWVPKEVKLNWRECSAPLQQRALIQNPDQRVQFQKALRTIHGLVEQDELHVDCFISYAWPSNERAEMECWVQPFILQLSKHLQMAGIRTYLDIEDSRSGFNSYRHMDRIKSCQYVILIGTESLVDKFKLGVSAITYEWNLMQDKLKSDRIQKQGDRIIPIGLTGSLETSFPAKMMGFQVMESFVVTQAKTIIDVGYVGQIKQLLVKLLGTLFNHPSFTEAWKNLPSRWYEPMKEREVLEELDREPLRLLSQIQIEHAFAESQVRPNVDSVSPQPSVSQAPGTLFAKSASSSPTDSKSSGLEHDQPPPP